MAANDILLKWDESGQRLFETGISRVVLYVSGGTEVADAYYGPGVAWNGVSSIQESPSGADANDVYADNAKYLSIRAAETFSATIEAYMSPVEFDECDGLASPVAGVVLGQQNRKTFGLCYRTEIGDDLDGIGKNYKLHFVYGLTASPSSRQYQTINESPEAMSLSWELASTPVSVNTKKSTTEDYNKVSTVTVDMSKLTPELRATLEAYVYGVEGATVEDNVPARLPTPDKIIALLTPSGANG